MATYNIEMNMLNSSGSYDVLYPKITSNSVLKCVKVSTVGAGQTSTNIVNYGVTLPQKPIMIHAGTPSGYGGIGYQIMPDELDITDSGVRFYPELSDFSRCALFVLNDGESYTIIQAGDQLISNGDNTYHSAATKSMSITVKAYTSYVRLTASTTGGVSGKADPTNQNYMDALFADNGRKYEWYIYYLD